jgi:sortase A
VRVLIRSLGEFCLTAGVIVLLFVAYELWGTSAYTQSEQQRLSRDLDRRWTTSEKVRLGGGLALLRIPRFGEKYRFVVIEGVSVADLKKGPGHYPGTAMPGQVGNFVISGHRTTYSAPFNRAGELRKGDEILVDTRSKQYVYQVTRSMIVRPTVIDATSPVPFHPTRRPAKKVITLTTCHPKYSAAKRLLIFGELVKERQRVRRGAGEGEASG